MTHLLVTNDFPPKFGGIQSYLWELWRRLPPETFAVLTLDHSDAAAWDRTQPYRVERIRAPFLAPTPQVRRRIGSLAAEIRADLVVLDPALPLGLVGPRLGVPYAVVLHGAEITVPARLPLTRALLRSVLDGAEMVVAAGGYPLAEAERAAGRPLTSVVIPPGVDTRRFHPLDPDARSAARTRFEFRDDATVVLGISRLVPRKGFDTLIEAAARVAPDHPDLLVVIAGGGRDRPRLERLAVRTRAPVRFLGRVDDDDLPALYGAADLFAMLCRNRWFGLEQEGFGIVFCEAAAAGVAQIAGRSGGSHEAVEHDRTGLVVDDPSDVSAVARALASLLDDEERRHALGEEARRRVERDLTYDVLAERLRVALDGAVGADPQ